MSWTLRTRWFKLSLELKHRWEKDLYTRAAFRLRKSYEIGLFLKTYQAVGVKRDLVNGFILGANLIVCKVWIDLSEPILESTTGRSVSSN